MGLGLFHPIDLNIDSCWEADYAQGYSGAAQYANTTAVGGSSNPWVDLNNGNNSFNSLQGTNLPTYSTNVINGHNVITFDTAAHNIGCSVSSNTNNGYFSTMTWYCIVEATSAVQTRATIVCKGNSNGWSISNNNTEMAYGVNNTDITSSAAAIPLNTWSVQYYSLTAGTNLTALNNNVSKINTSAGTPNSASFALYCGTHADQSTSDIDRFVGNMLGLYWFKRAIAAWEKALMDEYTFVLIGKST